MRAVDHRAALGPASLPSLFAKKSFSTFSWPICRYNSPTCASPALSSRTPPASKTTAAPSSKIFFQLWIWFGCTSYSIASSAIVRSPLSAATATFALNEALCFFRVSFASVSRPAPSVLLVIGAGLSLRHLSHFRGPAQPEGLRKRRIGKVGRCWHIDETYLKVAGEWCYLYRAIDRDGNLVDVYLSETRDM